MNAGKKSAIAALLLSFFILTCSAQAKYSGGSGNAGDPYKIGSAANLLALAADTGDYSKHFVLTADISLASYKFTTAVIARDTDNSNDSFDGTEFTGVFNGAGHKITKLTIDTNGAGNDYLGLFGYVDVGEIRNLGLENVSITSGDSSEDVGGLVGHNDWRCDVNNCYSTGTITGGDNSSYIGGLVGYNYGSSIYNGCFSTVTVKGGNNSGPLGGLVGGSGGPDDEYYHSAITNCSSTGTVTGGNDSGWLGGLAGYHSHGHITECFSTGAVKGGDNSDALGGLVGRTGVDNEICKCYSTGNVTGGNTSHELGGLVGYNNWCNPNTGDSYSTGNVTGGANSYRLGGLVGYNYETYIWNCYSTGTVKGGANSNKIGGLVGENYNAIYNKGPKNCYFLAGSGPNNSLGAPLTDSQMKQQVSFVGWNFDAIWTINEGISYPKLAWQSGAGETVDIGLRVYDGTEIVTIVCEPMGTLTSPLRIAKNGVVYGIVLVDPSDPAASKLRIQTSSGIKALRKF